MMVVLSNGVRKFLFLPTIPSHPKDKETFAWSGNDARQLFNLHPTLMVSGLVFFVGQAALTFRTCRCCRRMWNKVLHAASHLLAAPCAVGGFMAVLASRELRAGEGGETHFYSLHAWMGLATLGIFALQVNRERKRQSSFPHIFFCT